MMRHAESASRRLVCIFAVAGLGLATLGRSQDFSAAERIRAEAGLLAPGLSIPALEPAAAIRAMAPAVAKAADARALYLDIVRRSPEKLQGLSAAQRQELWTAVFRHPVAGLDDKAKLAKYDPQGFIGFCFGRSMTVHLLARQLGLREDAVSALFTIGELHVSEQVTWRFHVTALVKGEDGLWYAIDPIMAGPMSAAAWIAQVRASWDAKRKAKFYLACADAIIPDVSVVPDAGQETGARLIELSFEPAGKAGFTSLDDGVFELSADALRRHFKLADVPAEPFDFNGAAINGTAISYNGYFTDLLAAVAAPAGRPMTLAQTPPARAATAMGLNLRKLF